MAGLSKATGVPVSQCGLQLGVVHRHGTSRAAIRGRWEREISRGCRTRAEARGWQAAGIAPYTCPVTPNARTGTSAHPESTTDNPIARAVGSRQAHLMHAVVATVSITDL
jgi:hypothetical protein